MDVSASFDDADAAAEGVRLRVEMQRAVEEERCGVSAASLQPAGRVSSFSVPCNEILMGAGPRPTGICLRVCRCESCISVSAG